MSEPNIVTLSIGTYNSIKNDNNRLNMLLDSILNNALISTDHQHLVFDSNNIEESIKFCFSKRYEKRLSTLKTQNSRYGTYAADDMGKSNG